MSRYLVIMQYLNLWKLPILILLSCMVISGCSGADEKEDTDQIPVTVSIPPLEYLVKEIGGDKVAVTTLVPSSSDPETFDPTISQLRRASESEVIFITGVLPFEGNLVQAIKSSNQHISIATLADSINLLRGTHGDHDDFDPHIWTSLRNAKTMAKEICRYLVLADSENGDYFLQRYNRLAASLDSLDTAICDRLAPYRGSSFLVWHPSLSYFAKDYGLRQLAIGQEHKETSITGLAERLESSKREQPRAFFLQNDIDSRQAQTIAEITGLEPISIPSLPTDIEATIITITDAITN